MAAKIAFFDTKSYDRETFNRVNQEFGFEVKYYKEKMIVSTLVISQKIKKKQKQK